MKSKIIISLLIILLIPLTSAQTVDAEISHLIGYAEQYEMGNIDYLELLIQGSLTRNKVNKILGSFNQEERGPSGITADAAEQFFGVPKGYTKQAWSSSTDKNTKLEEEVPWFEKILFDLHIDLFLSLLQQLRQLSLLQNLLLEDMHFQKIQFLLKYCPYLESIPFCIVSENLSNNTMFVHHCFHIYEAMH